MLLAAAACQPVPRPFGDSPEAKRNPLLVVADRGGVVVLDVDGAPEPVARALPGATAEALQVLEIPAATAGGNRRSQFLQGKASVAPRPAARVAVRIDWTLVDSAGAPVGQHSVADEVPGLGWQTGDPQVIRRLAERSASGVAAILGAEPVRGLAGRPLQVSVAESQGGARDQALQRAMEEALRANRLRVAERSSRDDIRVVGRLSNAPAAGGLRDIEVTWLVLGPDGRELGRLGQRNAVPATVVDDEWPTLVRAVAQNAAPGVLDLLEDLPPDAAPQPRP